MLISVWQCCTDIYCVLAMYGAHRKHSAFAKNITTFHRSPTSISYMQIVHTCTLQKYLGCFNQSIWLSVAHLFSQHQALSRYRECAKCVGCLLRNVGD